ncbi:hypothetical protein HDU79_002403 [Rhizoclosmatium sp. JEL0117]|nr:hypothetical protein HDU79_002403 [Rhizoclosmatium sp. JEL0117]
MKVSPPPDESKQPTIAELQKRVFADAYYDSLFFQSSRAFDLSYKFTQNGRDLIVDEVDGPITDDRVDSGVQVAEDVQEYNFVIVMKYGWTQVLAESDALNATFYPHNHNFERQIEDLVKLSFELTTRKKRARVTLYCQKETCGPTPHKGVDIVRLATESGSKYCVIIKHAADDVKCIRVVGSLPFKLPAGNTIYQHVFGGSESLWQESLWDEGLEE